MTYSQHGEDDIIADLFFDRPPGYACEVGAGDGILFSNTMGLEMVGWTVLCIEPNPELFEALKRRRKLVLQVACSDQEANEVPFYLYHSAKLTHHNVIGVLQPLTEKFSRAFSPGNLKRTSLPVKVMTLDRILEGAGFAKLDFLSIDVDGIELCVLRGFDIKRWSPGAVLVENPFDDQEIADYFMDGNYREYPDRLGDLNDLWVSEELYEHALAHWDAAVCGGKIFARTRFAR